MAAGAANPTEIRLVAKSLVFRAGCRGFGMRRRGDRGTSPLRFSTSTDQFEFGVLFVVFRFPEPDPSGIRVLKQLESSLVDDNLMMKPTQRNQVLGVGPATE